MNCSVSVSLDVHIFLRVLLIELIEGLTLRGETDIRTSNFSLGN
jgi:hypothetical protein